MAARVRAHYDYAEHGSPDAEFASLIPDDLVPRFTFAGTSAAVRDQLEALAAIGVDEVALAVPRDPDAGGRDRIIETIGSTLIGTIQAP